MESKRIALLIDCDNVSPAYIGGVLDELAKYGIVNVRHAHGNWSSPQLAGWVEKIHPFAIRPMQQFAFTKGKNATDSAMIIDAMDLLYSKNVDAFALMTSDSDFTPLVLRLLESGLPVYGFGEKKTPKPFVDACSLFIYTENLVGEDQEKVCEGEVSPPSKRTRSDLRNDAPLVRLLRTATEKTVDDGGWSHLSQVGQYIRNNSSFSAVNYGYRTLGDLIRASELFDIDMRHGGTAMFIKAARRTNSVSVAHSDASPAL
ncbi:NYN domain-containing protein [Pseudomonas petrae]|uniref:NYN domain-containing protein n=1 Tax=Pseudomonas petrae TaxID=2912190 RepID=A0ABS9ICN5_9PSED|nr:NYN domain-containing protein [Pseudomonas petrae]MCF7545490.1 NYN domain-containing protein [Pseudomonas petrae]